MTGVFRNCCGFFAGAVTLNIHTMLFRPFGAGVPFDGFIADHDAAGRTAACGFKDLNFDMDCLPQC